MTPHTPHAGTDRSGPVVARETLDGSTNVSKTVVDTLDSLPAFDATDGAALYDAVDPDALDDLFSESVGEADVEGAVSFSIGHYHVVVEHGSAVVVRDTSRQSADAE